MAFSFVFVYLFFFLIWIVFVPRISPACPNHWLKLFYFYYFHTQPISLPSPWKSHLQLKGLTCFCNHVRVQNVNLIWRTIFKNIIFASPLLWKKANHLSTWHFQTFFFFFLVRVGVWLGERLFSVVRGSGYSRFACLLFLSSPLWNWPPVTSLLPIFIVHVPFS